MIAILLVAGLGPPTQLAQHAIGGHGDTIRVAADILTAHERPDDGSLYHRPTCHCPDMPREFAFAGPAASPPLGDLALRGTEADPARLGRGVNGGSRVWLVETGGTSVPTALTGMDKIATHAAGHITVDLYQH